MTVASSRLEREEVVGRLARLTRQQLLNELVNWTVKNDEIAEEAREVRSRRAESRTMLEIIAGELRGRAGGEPHELHGGGDRPQAVAS